MANISTMGRTPYALTATDILNGFAAVPVLWDTPFNDTNYNLAWSILDEYFPAPSLDFGQGDVHHKTASGFTAVCTLPAAAAIVQGQYDAFNTNIAQTDTFTPKAETLFQVTIYLSSQQTDGTQYDNLQASVGWTDSTGNPVTISPSDAILNATGNPVGNTYPVFSNDAGSSIVVSTAFTTFSITGTASGSFYGAGANMTQAVTGAVMNELNIPANGAGSIAYVSLASGVPDGTHVWTDNSDGGTFTPSGAHAVPQLDPFHYNLSVRIVQMPANAQVPAAGATVTVEAMASHR